MTKRNIKALEEKLETFTEKSDTVGQFQVLSQLGKIFQSQQKYKKALNYFRHALELFQDVKNSDDRTIALANLGSVYWEMAQLKKSVDLFEEALVQTKKSGDNEGQFILRIILGISYWRKHLWDQAILQFEQTFKFFPECKTISDLSKFDKDNNYEGLRGAIERGLLTLKNRARIAREHQNLDRLLQSNFAMLPLLFFSGRKEEVSILIIEIISLAQKIKREDILKTLTKFQKLINNH